MQHSKVAHQPGERLYPHVIQRLHHFCHSFQTFFQGEQRLFMMRGRLSMNFVAPFCANP
jgi:hypothetical protein